MEKTAHRVKAAVLTLRAIWSAVEASPRWRLTITTGGTILVGILSGLYANELAPKGVVAWSSWATVSSFWPLVILGLLWLLTQISFLRYDEARERAIERFADDVYCRGYVRRTNLEAYAISVKNDPTLARPAREVLKELGVKMQ